MGMEVKWPGPSPDTLLPSLPPPAHGDKSILEPIRKVGMTPMLVKHPRTFRIGGSSENVALLREYRDRVLSRSPSGKYQVNRLYSHSKELLQTLLTKPELILKAHQLIEKNLPEIQKAVNHQEAALQDQNGILAFLDSLASSVSPRTKIWISGLERELKRCQRTGMKFYGFKVSK